MSYLTTDHLGSPRITTDGGGAVISRHDYMAFGDEVTEKLGNVGGRLSSQGYGEADDVRKQYTGYERDKESGLDYAQARYYSSDHGRFTSVDPLTASANVKDPQTFNRYTYAMNSPYKFTDPLGLLAQNSGSACGKWCRNSDGGSGGGFVGLYSTAGQTVQIGQDQQTQSPPETPPAASPQSSPQQGGGITNASDVTPTVELENNYTGFYLDENGEKVYVTFSLPENIQNELQTTAEQAEQNQLAYLNNRDQALAALTSAWHYQDANSTDLFEDFWNWDNIPPTFLAPDGQVMPTGVASSNSGVGVRPVSGPSGITPSYGEGSGIALAGAANSNLSEVNLLRSDARGENFESKHGTVYVPAKDASGNVTIKYLNKGVLQGIHKQAAWKGIDKANQRYRNR